MAIKDDLKLEGQRQRELELLHDSRLPLVRTMLVNTAPSYIYVWVLRLPRTESEMSTEAVNAARRGCP
jgi:hypothetical protein